MTNKSNTEIVTPSQFAWQFSGPFISQWTITQTDIDHYQHTNNVAYLSRLEKLAWEHSNSIGLTFQDYQKLNRAMVITKHELHYHLASHLHDELACATWITECDKKFRLSRQFQFINIKTNKTVFSAKTDFVCVCLEKGAPKKMPKEFMLVYGDLAEKFNETNQNT